MTFQSTVNINQGFGQPGQLILGSPHRFEPLNLNSFLSQGGNNNIIGYAYTKPAAGGPAIVGGSPSTGASFTGVIAGNVLTASAVTGVITPGQTVVGAGVTAGTLVLKVLTQTGAVGGPGTYLLSNTMTVSSEAMTTTGTFVFAGLLGHSNMYKISGTPSGGTLAAQNYLLDNEQGSLMTFGDMVVSLPGVASIGYQLQWDATSGQLSAVAPGGAASNGKTLISGASVYRYPITNGGGGLTVARLTTTA